MGITTLVRSIVGDKGTRQVSLVPPRGVDGTPAAVLADLEWLFGLRVDFDSVSSEVKPEHAEVLRGHPDTELRAIGVNPIPPNPSDYDW